MLPHSPHLARDRYHLVRQLGEGASACVFEAFDSALGRSVALKRMKPTLPDTAAFLAEARILARLQHPHIVEIHDIGSDAQGVPYFVMELVEESLGVLLARKKTLTAEETLGLLLPIAGALAYVHDQGLTHRDLKPANIAVSTPTGRAMHGKLLDFGIARTRDQGEGAVVHGTPAYMAPEQLEGVACGPAADVWSLGVVAYQCLTGVLPFEPWFPDEQGRVRRPVCWSRAKLAPVALAGLPPVLLLVLERALEPNLTRRFADMREFARALMSAGIQAQLAVPADPDSVGLPDAPSWYTQLDCAHTQPQPARAQPALVPPASVLRSHAEEPRASTQPTEPAPAVSSVLPSRSPQPTFLPVSALGGSGVMAAAPASSPHVGSRPTRSRPGSAMRGIALFVVTLFGVLAGGAWWQWDRMPSVVRSRPAVTPPRLVAGGATAAPPVRPARSVRATLEPQASAQPARAAEGSLRESASAAEGSHRESARAVEGSLRPPIADVGARPAFLRSRAEEPRASTQRVPARKRAREVLPRSPFTSTGDGADAPARLAPTPDNAPAARLQLERNWEW